MFYKSLIRPLLFRKDPEESHERILHLLARLEFLYGTVEDWYNVEDERLVVKIGPLTFSNPVGLAAGFDKNVTAPKMISAFGFGFMEVGAVTAQAQPGNPKPRLYRLPEDNALINRLGFNNEGAAAIALKLNRLGARNGRPKIPLGMNIGRTKIVETKDAVGDFLACFAALFPHGDFFTLNVSSPNTPNLRDLQEKSLLRELLSAVQEKNRELSARANRHETGVRQDRTGHGILPSRRDHRRGRAGELDRHRRYQRQRIHARGIEIAERGRARWLERPADHGDGDEIYRAYLSNYPGRLPIIGVGGIFTAQDAYDKIKAGANAVQIYTGWVFEGPGAVKRINQGLLRLLERDGLKHIAEAVGRC